MKPETGLPDAPNSISSQRNSARQRSATVKSRFLQGKIYLQEIDVAQKPVDNELILEKRTKTYESVTAAKSMTAVPTAQKFRQLRTFMVFVFNLSIIFPKKEVLHEFSS
jgi:hypothetical protein